MSRITPRVVRHAALDWVKFDAEIARDGTIDPVDKALYAALATFVDSDYRDSDPDPNGADVPTRARLAECIGRSLDTVDRATKRLEARGLIHVERRRDPNNPRSHLPSVYELLDHERWDERAAARAQARRGSRTDAARGSRTDAARGSRTDAAHSSVERGFEKGGESSPSPLTDARQSQQPHQEEEISARGKTNPVSEHRADDAERHDDEHQAAAVELVVSLPGTPTGGNRARLVGLVVAAMSAGWTAQQIRAELLRDLGTAASRVAVWVSRLRDIGEPPAVAPAEISTPTPLPECDECGRPLPGGGLCRDCRQVEAEVTKVPGSRAAVEALRAQMGWMAAAS